MVRGVAGTCERDESDGLTRSRARVVQDERQSVRGELMRAGHGEELDQVVVGRPRPRGQWARSGTTPMVAVGEQLGRDLRLELPRDVPLNTAFAVEVRPAVAPGRASTPTWSSAPRSTLRTAVRCLSSLSCHV